jgi:hypothetical protein
MAEENKYGKTMLYMKAIGKTTRQMDAVGSSTQMEMFMRANGLTIKHTAGVFIIIMMVRVTQANGFKIFRRALASKSGLTVRHIKGNKSILFI